jgi:hypothetical protein
VQWVADEIWKAHPQLGTYVKLRDEIWQDVEEEYFELNNWATNWLPRCSTYD